MSDDMQSALSPQPSNLEREAFAWLQGRMVELLLRHSVRRLGSNFAARVGALFDDERHAPLRPYRELAVLLYLRDDLFESILPRIKRRLSFLAPRELLHEELPPRGRIDWPRTMAAGLRDRPGEPPLEVRTRQRRRHFATPENLLTVTTILEYRAAIQQRLDTEFSRIGARALRHPLRETVEQCTRELAFPQFVGLVHICERIADGDGEQTSAELEHAVAAQLLPGHNSAYEDLLTWRRNLAALRLLDRTTVADAPTMLGADPARDNYLYQIWLYYELAEMLDRRGFLEREEAEAMRLRFRWGAPGAEIVYQLKHDQAISHHWKHAPGVRPDLYLERVERMEVRHQGELMWREPGYVLDAKYYKPRDSARAPSGAVKRMIADLHLTGERHGALLFAFQSGERPVDDADNDLAEQFVGEEVGKPLYRVTPETAAAHVARPDAAVAIWRTRPQIDGLDTIQATLSAILDEAHAALRDPVPVGCHGIFIDALSASDSFQATAALTLLGSDGTILSDPNDILICPKPHVGMWRADLVSRSRTCCKDARLCHIIAQPNARPPVRPPRNARDLLSELEGLLDSRDIDMLDDASVDAVIDRIEALGRRLAEVTGALQNLARYEAKLGDIGLDRTLHLMGATERESLALAIYLRDQLDEVGANDYTASIIHVARVLERELQRRLLAVPNVYREDFPHNRPTLGSLGGVRRNNPVVWGRIEQHLAQTWVTQVDRDDPTFRVTVGQLIDELGHLVHVRNQAAHTTPIPRDRFRTILRSICGGSGALRIGVLNVLLIAWPA